MTQLPVNRCPCRFVRAAAFVARASARGHRSARWRKRTCIISWMIWTICTRIHPEQDDPANDDRRALVVYRQPDPAALHDPHLRRLRPGPAAHELGHVEKTTRTRGTALPHGHIHAARRLAVSDGMVSSKATSEVQVSGAGLSAGPPPVPGPAGTPCASGRRRTGRDPVVVATSAAPSRPAPPPCTGRTSRPVRVGFADALLVFAVGGRGAPHRVGQVAAEPNGHGRVDTPGKPVVTSWNSQPLPSGSLNETTSRSWPPRAQGR